MHSHVEKSPCSQITGVRYWNAIAANRAHYFGWRYKPRTCRSSCQRHLIGATMAATRASVRSHDSELAEAGLAMDRIHYQPGPRVCATPTTRRYPDDGEGGAYGLSSACCPQGGSIFPGGIRRRRISGG
jgi:hypothetical protein